MMLDRHLFLIMGPSKWRMLTSLGGSKISSKLAFGWEHRPQANPRRKNKREAVAEHRARANIKKAKAREKMICDIFELERCRSRG